MPTESNGIAGLRERIARLEAEMSAVTESVTQIRAAAEATSREATDTAVQTRNLVREQAEQRSVLGRIFAGVIVGVIMLGVGIVFTVVRQHGAP